MQFLAILKFNIKLYRLFIYLPYNRKKKLHILTPLRFLLIDDDSISNLILKKQLEKIEVVELLVAKNGAEALDILTDIIDNEKQYPDYILLDVNMPVLNGFEFLEKINTLDYFRGFNVPITMISSSQRDADKKTALSYNLVEQFIEKPIYAETLGKIISSIKRV